MTDPAIIAASYAAETNYSHNPDDVIDPSSAVLAIGTEKVDTTTLKDRSLNNNDATIHGAMPTEGFIQSRRFTAANSNYLNCGNDSSLNTPTKFSCFVLCKRNGNAGGSANSAYHTIIQGFNRGGNENRILVKSDGTILQCQSKFNSVLKTDTFTIPAPDAFHHIGLIYDGNYLYAVLDGVISDTPAAVSDALLSGVSDLIIGQLSSTYWITNGIIASVQLLYDGTSSIEVANRYNIFARLPFWSVNYTDYPDNVTEYTDNLPYSSSIISSGTFKVDDDVLNCVSAGTMTYSASYEFDGSEYIKVEIDGVEYAGTGTITQGNTTVSVAQGSNKITIQMGTADTIDKVRIQFRAEV